VGLTVLPPRPPANLLRLARRQPSGASQSRDGRSDRDRAADGRAGARRVWSDRNGNLWISEWNGGQLTRYNPATGEWKSWRPEGARPRVYAVYVDDRGIVWTSDFGANAVRAFDPATERWTDYPGSGDNANVRQILGAPGWIYLPESGLDRIMVVRTGPGS
jgi:virginiamycin B lyase